MISAVQIPSEERPYDGLAITVIMVVLNGALIAEVVRKYVWHSNLNLLFADCAALLLGVVFLTRSVARPLIPLLMGALLLTAYGLLTAAVGHEEAILAFIGLRSLWIPVSYLVVCFYLRRVVGFATAARWMYGMCTLWLLAIGAIAVLQLLLGPDHPINAIPQNLGDEAQGMGDYTIGDKSVLDLFRPTSIFLHTGKFGQVAFVLAGYCLSFRHASFAVKGVWHLRTIAELSILLLSGQRAAILFYVIGVLGFTAFELRRNFFALAAAALGVTGLAVLSVTLSADNELLGIVFGRAVSAVPEAVARLVDNVFDPASFVLEKWAVAGAGLGAFSLGGSAWGAKQLYDIVPFGTAENAWLRLVAEQGFVGALAYAIFWCYLAIWPMLRALRVPQNSAERSAQQRLSVALGALLAMLLLWSLTHDVLGNVTTMSLALAFLVITTYEERAGRRTVSETSVNAGLQAE